MMVYKTSNFSRSQSCAVRRRVAPPYCMILEFRDRDLKRKIRSCGALFISPDNRLSEPYYPRL